MSRLFDPDAPLMRFLSRVADLMILNILWIFLCIPVVTAGAATTALYRVCLNIAAQTDASVIRDFFGPSGGNLSPRRSSGWSC